MKEFKIWWLYTVNSFQQTLTNRSLVVIFLTGKVLRIVLFAIFLNFLLKGTQGLAGYSSQQVIFFYLSFNLVDTLAQLLFREVYRFRQLVVTGNLDLVLSKPLNPLLRVLLGGGDLLDLIMLLLIAGLVVWFGMNYISLSLFSWAAYLLLIINGLIIAAAFHILVLALGMVTTTIDHLIMVYRDFSSMLRIPIDLYIEPVRSLLTFVIPLGIMLTFPAKALMGLLSPQLIVTSLALTGVFLFLSLKYWRYSLKQYASAGG